MKLPQLPQDKANHLAYGAALACTGAFVSPIVGAALCAGFGIGKEIYDRVSKRGEPSVQDVIATLAGGALVLAPIVAPQLLSQI